MSQTRTFIQCKGTARKHDEDTTQYVDNLKCMMQFFTGAEEESY